MRPLPLCLLALVLVTSCRTATAAPVRMAPADVGDLRRLTLYLVGPITDATAEHLVPWILRTPGLTLVIDSPGGGMQASVALMVAVQLRGDVACEVRGLAGSGAFGVLQACRVRRMTAASRLATHELKWAPDGSPMDRGAVRAAAEETERSARAWNRMCAARLSVPLQEYEARVAGKDWVMGPEEALKVGAVDRVIP